jgi:hypothetical protein
MQLQTTLGGKSHQALAFFERSLNAQAAMLGLNDIFWLSAVIFVADHSADLADETGQGQCGRSGCRRALSSPDRAVAARGVTRRSLNGFLYTRSHS